MTTPLEVWLRRATWRLAKQSAAQVRNEITDHYESAREAAAAGGAEPAAAERLAIASLGDATTANSQYRRVLLTATEASHLRMGGYPASLLYSRRRPKYALIAILLALFLIGWLMSADLVLTAAIAGSLLYLPPLLPIYTPSRSRLYRLLKWGIQMMGLWLAFARMGPRISWLFVLCLCQQASAEIVRHSIRRKLPVSAWPKQLYL